MDAPLPMAVGASSTTCGHDGLGMYRNDALFNVSLCALNCGMIFYDDEGRVGFAHISHEGQVFQSNISTALSTNYKHSPSFTQN